MIGASGILSALFLNDTIVLMMTPIVLDVTRALRRNPLPYLIGLAVAANVGSTATITGNPQNIIIGSASKISYLDFAAALSPTALIGLVICWIVVLLVYRDEFRGGPLTTPDVLRTRVYRPLLRKAALVISLMLIAFLIGVPVPLAAFVAAAPCSPPDGCALSASSKPSTGTCSPSSPAFSLSPMPWMFRAGRTSSSRIWPRWPRPAWFHSAWYRSCSRT